MAERNSLVFDPDLHPDDTLKAFNEFIQTFELRYEATYPDPPKSSLDVAIERWRITQAAEDVKPTIEQYDNIREEWQSKDKVTKFLGIYSSKRFYSDWKMAEQDENRRKGTKWETFIEKMQAYYKPTENSTLKNFQFRSLVQEKNETFIAFCNRVEKEAQHCQFKCIHTDCTAQATSVRDQIIIGIVSDEIRQEALKNSWDLVTLRQNGMRLESASKSAAEISGDASIQKLGKYSYKSVRQKIEQLN